jgi:hypothetical protein
VQCLTAGTRHRPSDLLTCSPAAPRRPAPAPAPPRQGDHLHILVHPDPTSKREPGRPSGGGGGGPKKKKGEKEPRARPFNPAMQKWFALPGDLLPHPERLELLTHPQAVGGAGAGAACGGGGRLSAAGACAWAASGGGGGGATLSCSRRPPAPTPHSRCRR